MEIQLTRGYVAIIDDDDWPLIRGYKWIAHGKGRVYAISHWEIDGKRYHALMHRVILGLEDRSVLVDHKDGDGLNNRRENIRACSHSENMRNSKVRKHSKLQIRNVGIERINGVEYIRACVRKDGKRYRKFFAMDRVAEAEAWAEAKRRELHGDFAFDARHG